MSIFKNINKEKIKIAILIFLVAFAFFQIGFLYGTKFYEPCEIKIYKK
jgi:hypothetical protein